MMSFPLTPFTADGRLDLDAFSGHVAALVSTGATGLFAACGTGEFPALSTGEYRDLVRTAVRVADGRVPVFAGAGGGPEIARDFAAAAAESGADGLLLLPPYLVECPPAGLVRHVRHVAEATPLPLLVYQRANAVLDPDAAVALLDVPTVVGLKDGRGDIEAIARMVAAVRASGHPRAELFVFLNGLPTAELTASAYAAVGAGGYSSAALCFVPDLATAFHRAMRDGDERTRRVLESEFFLPFAELRGRVPGYSVALVKAGAALTGTPLGPVRPPLVDPEPPDLERLERIIARGRDALARIETTEAVAR